MANTRVTGSMTTGLLNATAIGTTLQPKSDKLQNIADMAMTNDNILQIKGGAIVNRTPSQVTADLIAFSGDSGAGGAKGVVPAPGAGDAAADKFLKADGTWDIPAGSGSGDVSGPASTTDGYVALFDGTTGKLLKASSIASFKTSLTLVKGDVGLGNVDNTSDATKNAAAVTLTNKTIDAASNTISNLATTMFAASVIDTDTTLAANSDARLATQKAVKAYADGLIEAANALQYKGTQACAANPNYPAANAGHLYIVSSAGKIGGASGIDVEVGDALICKTDSTASGTHASVGANWSILQFNLVGALTAANIGSTVQAYSAVLTALATGLSLATGALSISGTASAGSAVRLFEDTDNGTNYIGLKAPDTIGSNLTFTLPSVDGTNGQALVTDGSGGLSFATAAGGQAVGDILISLRPSVGSDYIDTGATYLKSSYAGLFAALSAGLYPAYNTAATKMSFAASKPAGNANAVAYSPDGKYLAIAHAGSPYIAIYDMSSGTPTKLANPATLPNNTGLSVDWSPNSRFLAVGFQNGNRLIVYDLQTGSPVKVTDPATTPTDDVFGVKFSPDGNYLATAHKTSPFMTVYPWSNSGFGTKLADPASLPGGQGNAVAWSDNSRYIAIAHTGAPRLSVYDLGTGSLVKENAPNTPPTAGSGMGVSWYKGLYIALGNSSSPFLSTYDFTGETTPTRMTDPVDQPSSFTGLSVHPLGNLLSGADTGATGEIGCYDISTPTLPVALSDITNVPTGTSPSGTAVAWAPHGKFLVLTYSVSSGTPDFMSILDMDSAHAYNPYTEFYIPEITNGWVKYQ